MTPNADTIWIVLIAIASIGANVATVFLAVAAFRKARTEVTFGFIPASKQEFERHENENKREHEIMREQIGVMGRDNAAKISLEIRDVHVRVNVLDKTAGRLEQATEMQNQHLAAMDTKITRILERSVK